MLKKFKKSKSFICFVMLLLFCITISACNAVNESLPDSKYEMFYAGMASNDSMGDNEEQYLEVKENKFMETETHLTQAFSLKVDTAAYTNVLRYINKGMQPPVNAIRTEELINYFNYDDVVEIGEEHPFGVVTHVEKSPFAEGKHMAYIRIKTEDINSSDLPPSNLTFLIDTSGSMMSYDKLPLLQQAFSLLVETLTENDTVSIVTYGSTSQTLLDSVSGADKERILGVINSLEASGSTAGAKGIQTAYELAQKNYNSKYNNRVILATDGDFNVGISDTEELKNFISEKRNSGVYLSVLGFGTGNLRDDIMETLAANGNGNYSYIDSITTAEKVLVKEMGANMFVVAKDVKAELRFNKDTVKEYRLVGYENRLMSSEEFDDEKKDAGEIGSGTDVVVLVELILQDATSKDEEANLLDVCIRYKDVENEAQKELIVPISNNANAEGDGNNVNTDFRFACAVAAFCEKLRSSKYVDDLYDVNDIAAFARENIGNDTDGYRKNFVELVEKYISMFKLLDDTRTQ